MDLICIKPFGTYEVGDFAGSVPDEAAYVAEFFAPAHAEAAVAAQDTKAQQIAQLEAELAELEKEDG